METFEVIYQNKIGKFSRVIKACNKVWAEAQAMWMLPGEQDDAGFPRDTLILSIEYCESHARSREFVS